MDKLNIQNIHKSYGNHEVLKGISLQAKAGDVISIIGSSGSGKSTFLRCINFLEKPNQGSISLNGEAIRLSPTKQGELMPADQKQLQSMRTKLAMVFQHFNLWAHMTVLENVIEAPVHVLGISKEEATQRAVKYLQKVGLDERAQAKYPAHLSGGQQQRVAIARALAMDPIAMLFDEPTSALDPEMINEVLDVMTELAHEGMTMMCVTHEMGFARRVANRVIFMDQGHIVEDCDKDEFFGDIDGRSERARHFLSKILQH